jgi:dihydroneopterin aldolase
MDRILIAGLREMGVHGVLAEEQERAQPFQVDLELLVDLGPAGASDALADTVDYGALAQALAAVVEGEPVDLLETLASRLVAVCLADHRVDEAEVTVHKPQAPIPLSFTDVAVTVRRSRRETS